MSTFSLQIEKKNVFSKRRRERKCQYYLHKWNSLCRRWVFTADKVFHRCCFIFCVIVFFKYAGWEFESLTTHTRTTSWGFTSCSFLRSCRCYMLQAEDLLTQCLPSVSALYSLAKMNWKFIYCFISMNVKPFPVRIEISALWKRIINHISQGLS